MLVSLYNNIIYFKTIHCQDICMIDKKNNSQNYNWPNALWYGDIHTNIYYIHTNIFMLERNRDNQQLCQSCQYDSQHRPTIVIIMLIM